VYQIGINKGIILKLLCLSEKIRDRLFNIFPLIIYKHLLKVLKWWVHVFIFV